MVQSRAADPRRQAARRRARRRDARRLEILRRAAEVFRAKGYHGAGMREIADGLGLAPGALYYYFRSKEDLLQACQELSLERLVAGGRRIAREARPAPERLRDLVAMHLDLTLDVLGGSAAHVQFQALPAARLEPVLRRRDLYERIVRGVIEDGIRDGAFRAVDAKLASMALLGALNWTVVWWRPGGSWTPRDLTAGVADLFLAGLSAGVVGDAKETDA
jgi:AcrR family transcriptional regulator